VAVTGRHQSHVGTPASDVRVVLFAGFLGSGKTTLISALVRRASELGLRLCLVVNEVGEVGIDGAVLRVGELEVRELTSGCICCQTGVDLVKTLWELNDHFSPDLVIVEASGIATPAGVLGALRQYAPELAPFVGAVTLVDPTRLAALYEVATPLIEAQIGDADLLVVTKADEASPEEIREACKVV
jgi:G3E family GTPase